jgi:hypothetical protein
MLLIPSVEDRIYCVRRPINHLVNFPRDHLNSHGCRLDVRIVNSFVIRMPRLGALHNGAVLPFAPEALIGSGVIA